MDNNFELSNPIIEPESRKLEQPGFDFDFAPATIEITGEYDGARLRECATCWKFQECDLRKSGATGCGELFY